MEFNNKDSNKDTSTPIDDFYSAAKSWTSQLLTLTSEASNLQEKAKEKQLSEITNKISDLAKQSEHLKTLASTLPLVE